MASKLFKCSNCVAWQKNKGVCPKDGLTKDADTYCEYLEAA